jgi:DNA-binding Lrp family transcriptional regulator
MRKLALVLCVAAALGGCAREPSLRSAFFQKFNGQATILDPAATPPGPNSKYYKRNEYAYVPGTFVLASVQKQKDVVAGLAEIWRTVQQQKNYCQQRVVKLLESGVVEREVDYIDDYRLDATVSWDPETWFNKKAIRATYEDISENEIGRLRRVTISLTNLRVYSLTPEQWEKAIADLKGRRCMVRLSGQGSLVAVKKVILGDINVETQYAGGVRFKTDVLKFHILQSGGDLRANKNAILGVIAN